MRRRLPPLPPIDPEALSKFERLVVTLNPDVYLKPGNAERPTYARWREDCRRTEEMLEELRELSDEGLDAMMTYLRARINARGGSLASEDLTQGLLEGLIEEYLQVIVDG